MSSEQFTVIIACIRPFFLFSQSQKCSQWEASRWVWPVGDGRKLDEDERGTGRTTPCIYCLPSLHHRQSLKNTGKIAHREIAIWSECQQASNARAHGQLNSFDAASGGGLCREHIILYTHILYIFIYICVCVRVCLCVCVCACV